MISLPTDLIKFLSSSNKYVLASFITSMSILLGKGILFASDDSLSGNLLIALLVVAIFSGVLLLASIVKFLITHSKLKSKQNSYIMEREALEAE